MTLLPGHDSPARMPEKVKLIFNDDGSDRYEFKGKKITLDNIVDSARGVEAALKKSGFETSVIPLREGKNDTLSAFISEIKDVDEDSIVFNLCEGAFGISAFEMHIAALLELYGARYTGSGPLTLGLALNKSLTKDILSSREIMTPEYCVMKEPPARLKRGLKFPLIVKPLREDASIGIDSGAVVSTMKELKARVEFITSTFEQPALVEEYVEGREFNLAVLGNGETVTPLPPSEIDFVDFPAGAPKICCYEAKWVEQSPFYKKTVPVCPADIPEPLAAEMTSIALKAYLAMGCRDYARVDMRLGEDNNIKVLEVNPNPDISDDAGFARAGRAAGFEYHELISEIVRAACTRPSPYWAGKERSGCS